MKQCAHCKELKPEEEFAFSNQILKKRQKHCRDCMREFNKKSYERRSEDRKERVKEDRKSRLEAVQRFVWDYLSTHPCVDCGESDPRVLEFDHIRGRKFKPIADMVSTGHAIESVRAEILKCEVRCANCHRIKTHKERGWFSG